MPSKKTIVLRIAAIVILVAGIAAIFFISTRKKKSAGPEPVCAIYLSRNVTTDTSAGMYHMWLEEDRTHAMNLSIKSKGFLTDIVVVDTDDSTILFQKVVESLDIKEMPIEMHKGFNRLSFTHLTSREIMEAYYEAMGYDLKAALDEGLGDVFPADSTEGGPFDISIEFY